MEAIAAYENRFARIEADLNLLKWMVGFVLALCVAILVLQLRHGRSPASDCPPASLPARHRRAPAPICALMQRILYLVAYDISHPRRLARALRIVRAYATGGQKFGA